METIIYTEEYFIQEQEIALLAFKGLLPTHEGKERERIIDEIERIEQYLSRHGRGVRS